MKQDEQGKKMGDIIAKCGADEGFKQRLLADANAALKTEGLEVPAGLSVKVVENTDQVINFVLSAKPKAELDDADLSVVAGGRHRMSTITQMDVRRLRIAGSVLGYDDIGS